MVDFIWMGIIKDYR